MHSYPELSYSFSLFINALKERAGREIRETTENLCTFWNWSQLQYKHRTHTNTHGLVCAANVSPVCQVVLGENTSDTQKHKNSQNAMKQHSIQDCQHREIMNCIVFMIIVN